MQCKWEIPGILVLIGLVFLPVGHATEVLDADELLDISFEELLNVEIISASRQR